MGQKSKVNVNVEGEWYGPDHGDKDLPASAVKALGPDHPALKSDDESEAAETAPPVSPER